MTHTPLKSREIAEYSALAFPLAFAGLPLYIHAPDFYVREIGISLSLIGILLLCLRTLDAVQDPLIGMASDRFARQRKKIILVGAALLYAGMGGLFIGPPEGAPAPVWFALSMILASAGFSVLSINLNLIGGLWRESGQERTKLAAGREALTLIGLLCASILPTVLQQFLSPRLSFAAVFAVFAVTGGIALMLLRRFLERIPGTHPLLTSATGRQGGNFFSILTGRNSAFFSVCFLTHLAAAFPGVLVIFFIRDYLGEDAWTGLFLMLYFLSGALFMPVWIRLSAKIGRQRAWLCSMVLAVATFAGAGFLQPGDALAYGFICALSGIALGGDLALPPSILGIRISQARQEHQAAQHYAVLSILPKIALAVASGAAFLALSRLGFSPAQDNSEGALRTLSILYTLIPCLIKIAAATFLFYLISKNGDDNDLQERSSYHGTAHIS